MGKNRPQGAAKEQSALRSFATVSAHADAADVVLMVLGLVGAIGDGISTPAVMFLISRVFNAAGTGPDVLGQFRFRSMMNEVQTPSLTSDPS